MNLALIGVENRFPICVPQAMNYNFTNEGGIDYRYRFLKNIMGLWVIQEVRRSLNNKYSFAELVDLARQHMDFPSIVDVDHDRFLKPDNMIEEIKEYCQETNQKVPEEAGEIAATGNYQGKARTPEELRADLDKALSLIPGKHKVNLHAIYAETNWEAVERDELKPEHFKNWVEWAKKRGLGLDFNPTIFSHPKAADGLTLSHPNKEIRDFWIRHCIASRKIGEYFEKELGQTCLTNIWIPDGYKDIPSDRLGPRQRLKDSLDEIFKLCS